MVSKFFHEKVLFRLLSPFLNVSVVFSLILPQLEEWI